MTDVLEQIVGQIGNVFESLVTGIQAVLGDFGNLSSEFVGGDDVDNG